MSAQIPKESDGIVTVNIDGTTTSANSSPIRLRKSPPPLLSPPILGMDVKLVSDELIPLTPNGGHVRNLDEEKLRAENERLKNENEKLKHDITLLISRQKELKEQLDTANRNNLSILNSENVLKGKLQNAEAEMSALAGSEKSLRNKVHDLEKDKSGLSSSEITLKDRLRDVENEFAQFKKENTAELQSRNESLVTQKARTVLLDNTLDDMKRAVPAIKAKAFEEGISHQKAKQNQAGNM